MDSDEWTFDGAYDGEFDNSWIKSMVVGNYMIVAFVIVVLILIIVWLWWTRGESMDTPGASRKLLLSQRGELLRPFDPARDNAAAVVSGQVVSLAPPGLNKGLMVLDSVDCGAPVTDDAWAWQLAHSAAEGFDGDAKYMMANQGF